MKKCPLLVLGGALVLTFVWVTFKKKGPPELQHVTGQTMGMITYNVKYVGEPLDLEKDINELLRAFNQSLSTYIPYSEISRLNETGQLNFESDYFYPVLEKSHEVFEATRRTYDPSIGPLIQAWGFGSDKRIPELDSSIVDSLKALSGFDKVLFDIEKVILPYNFQLDFSAIAKGYAVDLLAVLLENRNIENYLVEIGGEVRCKGINEKKKSWLLGIENPLNSHKEQFFFAVVRLRNRSLATSGNYRNYYKKEGRTYAHIIDPRTGYNAIHNLLSASVFADDCMSADAYATAFMVLGLDESLDVIDNIDGLDAVLIYQDEKGMLKSHITDGIKPFVEPNNEDRLDY